MGIFGWKDLTGGGPESFARANKTRACKFVCFQVCLLYILHPKLLINLKYVCTVSSISCLFCVCSVCINHTSTTQWLHPEGFHSSGYPTAPCGLPVSVLLCWCGSALCLHSGAGSGLQGSLQHSICSRNGPLWIDCSDWHPCCFFSL